MIVKFRVYYTHACTGSITKTVLLGTLSDGYPIDGATDEGMSIRHRPEWFCTVSKAVVLRHKLKKCSQYAVHIYSLVQNMGVTYELS